MKPHFTHTRRVEFADTDLAGIMHFSNFFRFMESAEHAFLRSLGWSVHREVDGIRYGWPRVDVSCKFAKPLRFEDEIEIDVILRERRTRSLRYEFQFRRSGETEILAQGNMSVVCTEIDRHAGTLKAVELPKSLAERLPQARPIEENKE